MAELPRYLHFRVDVRNGVTVDLTPVDDAEFIHVSPAKWLRSNNPGYSPFDPLTETSLYICSACGAVENRPRRFCAECGKRMEGGGDDERI